MIAGATLIILPFNDAYRSVGLRRRDLLRARHCCTSRSSGGTAWCCRPEEEFAMTHGEHGHPETEGYDVTEREIESGER